MYKIVSIIFFVYPLLLLSSSDDNFIDEKKDDFPPLVRSWTTTRFFIKNDKLVYKNFEKLEIFSTDFLKTNMPLIVHYKFKNNDVFDVFFENYKSVKFHVFKEFEMKDIIRKNFENKYIDNLNHMDTIFFKNEMDNLVKYYIEMISFIPLLENQPQKPNRKEKSNLKQMAKKMTIISRFYREAYLRLLTQFSDKNKKIEPFFIVEEKKAWLIDQYLVTLLGEDYASKN